MNQSEMQHLLQRALAALDTTIAQRGWTQPPLLLRLTGEAGPEGDVDLGVRELDCHPAEALLGFSAPTSWTAVGVSAEGWATSLAAASRDCRAEEPAATGPKRVRSLVLLGRQGDAAGRIRWEDGRCLAEPPAEGLILDCLRRALGQPTPPPAATTNVLFATMWLENVLVHSRQAARRLTWSDVTALHPALQLLARDRLEPELDDVERLMRALGEVCDWPMVREQTIRGWQAGLDPSLAAWMDAGMLSRWLLDRGPDLDELLHQLAATCSPSVLHRTRKLLLALGIVGAGGHPAGEPDVA